MISLYHQYRATATCTSVQSVGYQIQVLISISLKMIMESYKNGRWFNPFKNFGRLRVNDFNVTMEKYYFYLFLFYFFPSFYFTFFHLFILLLTSFNFTFFHLILLFCNYFSVRRRRRLGTWSGNMAGWILWWRCYSRATIRSC